MARVCFVSRIRTDQIETYRARHAEVWPEMLQALHETGWRDYTLHLAPDGLLVGVVDVDDFDAARDAMAEREVNARWQAEMATLFGSDGPPDEGFVQLECVFDLDAQRAAGGLADVDGPGSRPGRGPGPADATGSGRRLPAAPGTGC